MRSSFFLYIFCALLLLLSSVQVVSAEGGYECITQWGSSGWEDGQFLRIGGISVDDAGNVYASDTYRGRMEQFTSDGTFITTWGSGGTDDGWFVNPYGVAVDSAGNIYVADSGNSRIQKFDSSRNFITQWGEYGDPRLTAGLRDVAVDSAGNVYAADMGTNLIQKFTSNGMFITAWGGKGSRDGQFNSPSGVAVDSAGNVYVADSENYRIQKFTSTGAFLTKWGSYGSGDGQFGATWGVPYGVAVDDANNVYVADFGNKRIQKFTSTGTFITKWGVDSTGDGQLYGPTCVDVDSAGNVYVNYDRQILKFAPEASLTTDFTATLTAGSAPLTVQFTDTSTGSITAWQWDFNNDGIVDSTLQNPTFTYAEPGNYSVKLSVTGTGGTKSTVKPNYIVVSGPLSVDSITPDSAISTLENVAVSVRGKNFSAGTTFKLVNATLGTIACLPNTVTRVSDTELTGKISFTDVKEGLYDVVVTTPDGTTKSLEKGFHVLPIPVVLIHGWNSGPGMWDALTPALNKEGIQYWNFPYDASADPTASADVLATYIRDKRSSYRPDLYPNGYTGKIDIVCHSMGAIVSRWYMEHNGHGNEVRQWIGIAPAHGGSAGADLLNIHEGPTDTTLFEAIICSALGDSTRYLKTTTDPAMYLKYDQLSRSTTYRVIAGWNPFHDVRFGYGALYRTRAVALNGSYYWTFNGDMIVATAQSYREGMGFECFPNLSGGVEGGINEPGYDFDHVHIHHSPAVINRVIKYLENPDIKPTVEIPVDPNEDEPYDISIVKTVSDMILAGQIHHVIEHSFTILSGPVSRDNSISQSGIGTTVTDMLFVDLNWTEGSLSLELTDPNGQTFTSSSSTSTAWSMSDSNHVTFTIASPTAGNWSAKIIPLSLPDHAVGYNLTMYRSTEDGTLAGETPTIAVVPGGSAVPRDLTGGGLYKDVNGNGAIDFNDVVLYFNQMDWIATNEPVSAFDFNKNGQIDFNDIVILFNDM
ncbi:PKD domain-containing protein [Methanosphaerula subterraneus]|uniref:PKD domain-containing protein n=1 Tax=Methanosphaerula subterraneus TaxID=3350244 RepID=UPI003F87E8E7